MQSVRSTSGGLPGCLSGFLFTSLFFLIGAGLSGWGWTILQNAQASDSWPGAAGQITRSSVNHTTDVEGGDSYAPQIRYTFTVDNQTYEGRTIKFGENSYDRESEAEAIVRRYPQGRAVTVYYDPADPETAVLEPGVSSGSYIVLGIGLLFLCLSLLAPLLIMVRGLAVRRG